MDTLTPLALITAVLMALWTFFSLAILPELSPWIGLAAWGCFFAAGGRTQGLQKTVFASLSGLVYVWVMMQLLPRFGGSTLVYAILLGAIALLMVVQSKIPQLSFIPGAFIGAGVTVGSGGGADLTHLLYVGLSLAAGAALGFASETVAGSLGRKSSESGRAGYL